jgi:hypothetical protein
VGFEPTILASALDYAAAGIGCFGKVKSKMFLDRNKSNGLSQNLREISYRVAHGVLPYVFLPHTQKLKYKLLF